MVNLPFRKRPRAEVVDEHGGTAEGGLVMATGEGEPLHVTPKAVADALRFLVARVQGSATSFPSRLALTSALHGEGVTYMARSLATVLAYDSPDSVVLVDLNFSDTTAGGRRGWRRKQKGDTALANPDQHTLVDAIENAIPIDEILQPTANKRLHLVVAGELATRRRSAVAGSAELEKLIDEIASRFDRVLLDLPPVLASSDAITLAQLANGYLLVVQHGVATVTQVETAMAELTGTRQLGVIVNRFESSIPGGVRRLIGA